MATREPATTPAKAAISGELRRVIAVHAQAPTKPALGSACNGCGWCCAAEPCPLGVVVSGRLSGACKALVWQAGQQRHGCGVLQEPGTWLPPLRALPRAWAQRLVARWIAAGKGCDADIESA